MHEAGEPDVLVGLLDVHLLSRKDLADVDLATLIANAAARGDDGRPIVQGVCDLIDAAIDTR
jgi:hypothetical protein